MGLAFLVVVAVILAVGAALLGGVAALPALAITAVVVAGGIIAIRMAQGRRIRPK